MRPFLAAAARVIHSVGSEFCLLSIAAAKVRAERDDEVCEIRKKSLKVVAEVPAVTVVSAEMHRVRADVEELAAMEKGLAAKPVAIATLPHVRIAPLQAASKAAI